MLTHSSRIAFAALSLAMTLAACGSSTAANPEPAGGDEGGGIMLQCAPDTPDCNDTGVGDQDGSGDPFATCPVGTPDCNDTPEEPAGDCPSCDPASQGIAEGEPNGSDERMNPSITVVPAFTMETPLVEMAPGSVEAPLQVFLQEAVVDGANVTISFSGGEAPCFVVDHAVVTEDADQVVVTFFAGQSDPTVDCSSTSTSIQAITVTLDADLGSRLLLDGSRMQGADNV